MKYGKSLFDVLERLAVSTWRRTFERPQMIKGWLLKTSLIVSGRLSCEIGVSAYLFAKEVIRLYRKSGALHCSLYLKQCSSSLQSAYGGIKACFTSYTSLSNTFRVPPSHSGTSSKDDVSSWCKGRYACSSLFILVFIDNWMNSCVYRSGFLVC